MVWYKEKLPLLLKCFKTSLENLYQKGTVCEGMHLCLRYVSFCARTIRLNCQKITEMIDLRYTLHMEIGVIGGKGGHPLLLICYKTLLE